jgi:hypothetical protein
MLRPLAEDEIKAKHRELSGYKNTFELIEKIKWKYNY